jgi:hypothetical protein
MLEIRKTLNLKQFFIQGHTGSSRHTSFLWQLWLWNFGINLAAGRGCTGKIIATTKANIYI